MKISIKRAAATICSVILCVSLGACDILSPSQNPEVMQELPDSQSKDSYSSLLKPPTPELPSEPEPEPDPDMILAKEGEALFSVLIPDSADEAYIKVLEKLQLSVERAYGVRFDVISDSQETDNAANEYNNVIFFGDTGADHASIEGARALTDAGSGFAVKVSGSCIALYAHSHRTLSDLTDLFIMKYVNKDGELRVPKDVSLSRTFTDADETLCAEYDHTLPVLHVDTNGTAITSRTEYIGASVSISNTYKEFALENCEAQIRGRGNGSWETNASTKRPYRLKLAHKENLLGTGSGNNRDWVLLSNSTDFTQVRNSIAFTLGRKVFSNIQYTTDYTFVNLYLSGRYAGVYMICDQMEIASHRINVEEDPDSEQQSEYFIELDAYAKEARNQNVRDVDYFKLQNKYWVIKSDYNTKARCSYVKSVFEAAFNAIEQGDMEQIARYIDLPSCIDMYLLHEYCKNTDVGWSSFYMVLKSDGRIYFNAPWDFDLSSGNDDRIHNASYEKLHAGNSQDVVKQSNPIFYKLMKLDGFRNAAASRWTEISDAAALAVLDVIDEHSLPNVDDFVRDIDAFYNKRTSYNRSKSKDPYQIFADNLEYLKTWYANRTKWMDSYFSQPAKEESSNENNA